MTIISALDICERTEQVSNWKYTNSYTHTHARESSEGHVPASFHFDTKKKTTTTTFTIPSRPETGNKQTIVSYDE